MFLLKGAMLFVVWRGNLHRPTKDLDLVGFGDPAPAQVAKRIADIAEVFCDDGVIFEAGSIETELIKVDADYEGVRVHLLARLEQAKVRLQIDIGFGDAVTIEAPTVFPTILDRVDAPILRTYPAEAVIAEKLHAMVVLDIRNSRMKDFYDLWVLARSRFFVLNQLVILDAEVPVDRTVGASELVQLAVKPFDLQPVGHRHGSGRPPTRKESSWKAA